MTDISHFYGDDCDPPHEKPSWICPVCTVPAQFYRGANTSASWHPDAHGLIHTDPDTGVEYFHHHYHFAAAEFPK